MRCHPSYRSSHFSTVSHPIAPMLVPDRLHDHELKDLTNTPRPNPSATEIAGYEQIAKKLKGVGAQIPAWTRRGTGEERPATEKVNA